MIITTKDEGMRLVFPTNENNGYLSKRGAHFGKAKYYTIVTLKDLSIDDVEVIKNPGHDAGGCGNAIANIMNLNPSALIVSGIGGSPAKGFANAGLDVYFDSESKTVSDSIQQFLSGRLNVIGSSGTCSTH
jgi:predicted Fe-Mo cluster-binding NifX family protein